MEPNQQNQTPANTPVDTPTVITPTRRIDPNETELTQQTATEPVPVASPAPVMSAEQPMSNPTGPAPLPASTSSKRSLKKPLIIVAAVIALLIGASVAAYAAVIVPNKPENVLLSALDNTLQQKQVSYKGAIDISSDGNAVKADIRGAHDGIKQADELQINVTTSGITLPVEARLVDKNIYIKFGDLTPITTLLGAYGGEQATGLVTIVNQQLSNKWIAIDSTLLAQAGADCVLNSNYALTKSDIELLKSQYKAHPFVMIQSSAGDSIDGQNVTKYQISIDDDTAVKYGNSLDKLSFVPALDKCSKGVKDTASNKAVGDHDKTPLTIWVNKKTKQIVQIASESTAADAKKGVKGNGKITFSYAPVTITAPTDSTPAITVLANLQKALGSDVGALGGFDISGLLGSGIQQGSGDTSTKANDIRRQTNISALQTQLEAFYSENGYYPSLADMNSDSWLRANLKSLDRSALVDPDNASQSQKLVAAPATKSYAYAVADATDKSCEAAHESCAKYKLTATLSTGRLFSKDSLN